MLVIPSNLHIFQEDDSLQDSKIIKDPRRTLRKTAWHGERLLKCLTIHAKIILGTQVKSLSILTLNNCIITIEVNGDFQLFHAKMY